MKVIARLLFVALLIGVALGLPSKVSASNSELTCNFPAYGQCYGALQQWMNTCAWDCSNNGGDGTPTQVCFSVPYSDCEPKPGGGTNCVTATNTSCWDVTSNGASCISGCINQYTQQLNQCVAEYCY
jgi:hypothetical protein